MITTENYPF